MDFCCNGDTSLQDSNYMHPDNMLFLLEDAKDVLSYRDNGAQSIAGKLKESVFRRGDHSNESEMNTLDIVRDSLGGNQSFEQGSTVASPNSLSNILIKKIPISKNQFNSFHEEVQYETNDMSLGLVHAKIPLRVSIDENIHAQTIVLNPEQPVLQDDFMESPSASAMNLGKEDEDRLKIKRKKNSKAAKKYREKAKRLYTLALEENKELQVQGSVLKKEIKKLTICLERMNDYKEREFYNPLSNSSCLTDYGELSFDLEEDYLEPVNPANLMSSVFDVKSQFETSSRQVSNGAQLQQITPKSHGELNPWQVTNDEEESLEDELANSFYI